jgi:hypothetical protein
MSHRQWKQARSHGEERNQDGNGEIVAGPVHPGALSDPEDPEAILPDEGSMVTVGRWCLEIAVGQRRPAHGTYRSARSSDSGDDHVRGSRAGQDSAFGISYRAIDAE